MKGEVVPALQFGFVYNFAAKLTPEQVGQVAHGHGGSRNITASNIHLHAPRTTWTWATTCVRGLGEFGTVFSYHQRIDRKFFARVTNFQLEPFGKQPLQH